MGWNKWMTRQACAHALCGFCRVQFDGVLRKVQDEAHYGNSLGLDGSSALSGGAGASGLGSGALERASNGALLTAQSVHDLLQSVVGAHLPAWKAFLNNSLRAMPSALPSSPNPLSISGPIPPLSQQLLLQALSAYLTGVLLPHQLSLVVSQLHGQNHYILGRILRGAAFPVDTHMQGAATGGACGLRQHSSVLQARLAVMRTFMAAAQARHQQHAQQQGQRFGPAPAPIFYLSPSFAHALGFPECLPRLCWELGVSAASFKARCNSTCKQQCSREKTGRCILLLEADTCACCAPVSYTHLTLPTKRIV